MPHTVFCVKFKKEMPGLDEPPFDNELGKKVYDNVSQEAWRMWMEHCKMLLNEYRLNPPAAKTRKSSSSNSKCSSSAKARPNPKSMSLRQPDTEGCPIVCPEQAQRAEGPRRFCDVGVSTSAS